MSYQPPTDLPIEFGLALACCRWTYAGDSGDAVARISGAADWAAFVATCRRHRVQGLAWHALNALKVRVPAAAEMALAGDARTIAEQGLRAALESQRLLAAFTAHQIPLLFLKGLPVGAAAYGKPFAKMSWDVDLLVLPSDLEASATLLRKLGYRLAVPGADGALSRWHELWKESIWRSGDGIVVELHSRVADHAGMLPTISALSPSLSVSVTPGIELPTLADAEQFAYLAVHGGSSAWYRLKWITDFAAFLHGRSASQIESLYEQSQQLGSGRAAGQALLLAQRLYRIEISEALARRLDGPAVGWLCRVAIAKLLAGEPTERPLGTLDIHLAQFLLMPGARFKLNEFVRQVRTALSRP